MKRIHKGVTAVTTLAVLGGVALSPLGAHAENRVDIDVQTNDSVKIEHSMFNGFGRMHVESDDDSASTSVHVRGEGKDDSAMHDKNDDKADHMTAHGEKMIDVRISILEKLQKRFEDMKRLSSDDKSALSAQISAQITALTNLKAQIDAGTSTTTIKDDIKSIRPDLRIFALVAPRAAITAAADRITSVVSAMETIGSKLETRIATAKTAGKDVSAAETAYADYKVQIANAKVEAKAALDLVVDLKADNGDQTVFTHNKQVLTEARAKIKEAASDLKAARADIKTIVNATKDSGVHASSTVETH